MAEDKELSQLEAVTNPSANDLMYIVSGGNSRKIPYGNVFPKDDYYTKTQMDTALAGKEPTISVTPNRALVSDANGKVSASSATSEEVGYLSGVTGAIQTQINNKQNTLTFDSTPTAQSTNPVTSGGIKTYVDGQGAKTVSGNPITLTDAEAMNADHVVATITPTQTGSGTPSPSNVRPFTGFSNVDLNIGNDVWTGNSSYSIQSDGNLFSFGISADVISFGEYELQFDTETPNGQLEFIVSKNTITQANKIVDIVQNSANKNSFTFSINESAANYIFTLYTNSSSGLSISNIVLNKVSNTYTVQLGDTYYQGDIDVTSGKLTVTHGKTTITGLSRSNATNYYTGLPNAKANSFTVMCDKEVSAPNTTSVGVYTNIYSNLRLITATEYESSEACLAAYGGSFDVCYELETPIEIQLTPQQIELLLNNNTITTNVSSLDITYQTNTAIGDTASALDKRVTRLESKVPQPPTTDGTYKLTVTVASGEPTYSWESAT